MILISRIWPRIPASLSYSIRIRELNSTLKAWAKKSPSSPRARNPVQTKAAESVTQQPPATASGLRVVAIGGGTGLSTLLKGLKQYVVSPSEIAPRRVDTPVIRDLSAVVTVS